MKKYLQQSGFGLIEILVSVGIFALVATMGVGAIMSMIDAGERSQALNSVMQNLNIALETMAREVRTGQHYACPAALGVPDNNISDGGSCDPLAGNTQLQFQRASDTDSQRTLYYLSSDHKIMENTPDLGANQQVSADEVVIDDLRFFVFNTGSKTTQPWVRMNVTGHVQTRSKNVVTFSLQTSMTQRVLSSEQGGEF